MTKSLTPPPQSPPVKRPSCTQCLRPLNNCLCKHIRRVNNQVELIILQHPLEVHEAKNTARLLHLCLNNSQLYRGEQFNADFFEGFTKNTSLTTDSTTYDLLLYPETSEEKSMGISTPPTIESERLIANNNGNISNNIRLWVLDATWRKSRKMLYLNSALQAMPRLKLYNSAPTMYTIRKAHNENQLSTLEASCYALQQLEKNKIDYTPVLAAFADFITQQKSFIPTSHL